MQRSPSTVIRELARNGWTCPGARPIKRGRPPVAGGYRAAAADRRARQLAVRPRCPSHLATDGPLGPIVEDLLRQRHSPEQIAGRLARMPPDRPTLQARHETIYPAIDARPRGELRSERIAPACASRARRGVRVLAARIVAKPSPTSRAFMTGPSRSRNALFPAGRAISSKVPATPPPSAPGSSAPRYS